MERIVYRYNYTRERKRKKKIKRVIESILSTCAFGLIGIGIGSMFYLHLKEADKKKEEYRKCLYEAPRNWYRIKSGDTLWEICEGYGWRSVCIEEIQRINGIDANLRVDKIIDLPDKDKANECYLNKIQK